jgi:hypothetical protein
MSMKTHIFLETCVSLMSDQSPLARAVQRLRKEFKRLISSLDIPKVFQRIRETVNGDFARACDRYWEEVAGLRDTLRGRFSRTKNGIHFQPCLVARRVLLVMQAGSSSCALIVSIRLIMLAFPLKSIRSGCYIPAYPSQTSHGLALRIKPAHFLATF